MTCKIGYISEQAKNCIPNPPWGEGCEICVKQNWLPIWILLGLLMLLIAIGVAFIIIRNIYASPNNYEEIVQ